MSDPLTVKEAAARLRLSPQVLYKLLASGAIPCRRLGEKRGKILLDAEDVAAYWDGSKGAAGLPLEGREPIRMASRHLRPPSPARPLAAKSRP